MLELIIMLQTEQFELIKAMTQILPKEYNRASSIKALSLSECCEYFFFLTERRPFLSFAFVTVIVIHVRYLIKLTPIHFSICISSSGELQ